MESVQAIISLGMAKISNETLAALVGPNVSVQTYVDQWRMLQEVDVFFTHQGMNSTHERSFIAFPWSPILLFGPTRFGREVPTFGLAIHSQILSREPSAMMTSGVLWQSWPKKGNRFS